MTRDEELQLDFILNEVKREYIKATKKFGEFNSSHEGYAVILEELDELWEHVKNNTGHTELAMREAKQVAAMAIRYMVDVCANPALRELEGVP